jgi:hypothetical protein
LGGGVNITVTVTEFNNQILGLKEKRRVEKLMTENAKKKI